MSPTNIRRLKVPTVDERLQDLDRRVDAAESDGILARWEFGKALLAERKGKQLPKGRLDEVAALIGKQPREVQCRMQFAERFPTENEVRDAVTHFDSWRRIVHEALPEERSASITRLPSTTQEAEDEEEREDEEEWTDLNEDGTPLSPWQRRLFEVQAFMETIQCNSEGGRPAQLKDMIETWIPNPVYRSRFSVESAKVWLKFCQTCERMAQPK
jgi:hypothetical protein